MCDCKSVEVGSYANTIILGYYPCMRGYRDNRKATLSSNGISVDRCIANEVISLWELGIRTMGSCCGHNKADGWINVHPEDFDAAIGLGYEKHEFPEEPNRYDTVWSKSCEAVTA